MSLNVLVCANKHILNMLSLFQGKWSPSGRGRENEGRRGGEQRERERRETERQREREERESFKRGGAGSSQQPSGERSTGEPVSSLSWADLTNMAPREDPRKTYPDNESPQPSASAEGSHMYRQP